MCFLLVRKVVERKVLSKFGEHWRPPELAAVAGGSASAEKVFLVGKNVKSLMD